ncbi:NTPase [Lysinibacillus contaminans]|uniref:inosine/xanthosine triphosphatase n=1 Tax=Lysinibacillus contaminans TaxID=1293441 RepID=A0ABR5JY74_9BACI|nr:DUF84 family protein [Lysinibacillus contaminans]KOS67603.1 NTPase [Lysinibacillus contaminans]
MNIAIGTTNKAKIGAVEVISNRVFENTEFTYYKAASDVSEQPMTTEETRQGAINRARNTMASTGSALSFGLEGGVTEIEGVMYVCNWGALVLADGTVFTAAGAQIVLPIEIAQEIRAGKELGPVMEAYTQRRDIRQHIGAVGIFTQGLVDRQAMFEHIVALLVGQYLFVLSHN